MRIFSLLISLLLGASALVAAQTPAVGLIEPKGDVTYPISARLEGPPVKAEGSGATIVIVHVRNTVTEAGRNGVAMTLMAVVLRGVRWAAEPVSKDDKRCVAWRW